MDEDQVLLAIGGLTEAVKNQGREILEIKTILNSDARNCRDCKKEIDTELASIKNTHTGETAVRRWKDRTLGEVATMIGAGAGMIALVAYVVGYARSIIGGG